MQSRTIQILKNLKSFGILTNLVFRPHFNSVQLEVSYPGAMPLYLFLSFLTLNLLILVKLPFKTLIKSLHT